jgi:hypothetical protein
MHDDTNWLSWQRRFIEALAKFTKKNRWKNSLKKLENTKENTERSIANDPFRINCPPETKPEPKPRSTFVKDFFSGLSDFQELIGIICFMILVGYIFHSCSNAQTIQNSMEGCFRRCNGSVSAYPGPGEADNSCICGEQT